LLVWNNSDASVAAAHSVDPDRWWTAYGAVLDRIESRFTRYEQLRRAGLYLPKSWTSDAERCRVAGIASEVQFATKPALATAMITRAIQAGVPAGWVAGDEVYGADPLLRRAIREHHLGYALQVAAKRRVPTLAGPMRVDALAATMPDPVWQRYSCGPGSKGPRYTTGPGSGCSPRTTTTPTTSASITC